MIDDDSFDNIVRRMFEQFFGKGIRLNPYDSKAQIEFDRDNTILKNEEKDEPFVDVIEFDNEIMIIIDPKEVIDTPEATITEGLLSIRMNSLSREPIEVKLPAAIDVDASKMSTNNGIIELQLRKTDEPQINGILVTKEEV